MNKLIQELAEQAELHLELQSLKVEKFAELIVRECVKLLPPEMTHGPDGRPLEQVFKQHFGVEQ
jgi:hypothetical protein